LSFSALKATRDMNPHASLKDRNFNARDMFVSSAFGFHFRNDLRVSERSEGVNRTVFDVDMNLAGVLEAMCRSIDRHLDDRQTKKPI
jgi:hypothetical protein